MRDEERFWRGMNDIAVMRGDRKSIEWDDVMIRDDKPVRKVIVGHKGKIMQRQESGDDGDVTRIDRDA